LNTSAAVSVRETGAAAAAAPDASAGGGGIVTRALRSGSSTTRRSAREIRGVSRAANSQVRSIQKFFTHRPVSTFDRVPFQLTGELFLYGMALSWLRQPTAKDA
jgi:hypothetical protein